MRLSPRQREIVALVAAGRSDKQIANELGVSHRTVRTHLEKLFRRHGLHTRSEAVAASLRDPSTAGAGPADECPFPRPLPEGFADCPAYQPRHFVNLDLSHQPVGVLASCRHLTTGRKRALPGGFYAACSLGDAHARLSWVAAVGAERLTKIGKVRNEMAAMSDAVAERLWALKGKQLQASASKLDTSGIIQEMEAVARHFNAWLEQFLRDRKAELDDLQLPANACLELMRVAVRQLIEAPGAEIVWQVPDDLLLRFPADTRIFFRPQMATRDNKTAG